MKVWGAKPLRKAAFRGGVTAGKDWSCWCWEELGLTGSAPVCPVAHWRDWDGELGLSLMSGCSSGGG